MNALELHARTISSHNLNHFTLSLTLVKSLSDKTTLDKITNNAVNKIPQEH